MPTIRLLWAAVLGATALAAPLQLGASGAASAASVEPATTTPIKHLVVIYQENASFDHYFGTYPIAANPDGEPAFIAREGTPPVDNLLPTALNGNRDLRVTNPNQALPFRLDRTQFATCSQDHGYRAEQRAANGGLMNRFVQATDNSGCKGLPRAVPSPQVMGYFDGNTVTALWNYAQRYALNDHTFGTNYGPSTPGALNLAAGRTSGASPDNPDNVTGGVVYGDADPTYDDCSSTTKATASLNGTNVGDLLTQAGVSWGWFQGGFHPRDSADGTDQVPFACTATDTNLAGLADGAYEPHHDPFQYFASTANPHHLAPSTPAAIGHDDPAHHQYDLSAFWTAADAGNMPAVSFLKAPGFQDGHPGPSNSDPLDEQDFLVSTLDRLQNLPEWQDTAVVLAWDDSDGWYDHEPPPNVHHSNNLANDALYGTTAGTLCMAPARAPAPDPKTVFPMRCGYGERLPLLVVSPYARDNVVDHTPLDQTSILRFIEDNWGLPRLGQGSFDGEAGSMLGMFDFDTRRADTLLLDPYTGEPDIAPSIDDLSLTPDQPRTNDVLTASVATSDPDHDPTNPVRADRVTTTFDWFNGDTEVAHDVDHLDLSVPGNGDRGDTITVRATASDGVLTTVRTASTEVGDSAPTIRLTDQTATADYSDAVGPIGVTVSDADDDDLTVDTSGLPEGLALSRADDGSLSLGGVVDSPAGRYDGAVRVSDGELFATAPLGVTVSPEGAHVAYTGNLLFSTGSATSTTAAAHLQAHIRQDDDGSPGDLTRASVEFDLYASGNTTTSPDAIYRADADANGDASVDVPALGPDTWTVVVRTDPRNGFFAAAASDVVPVTVYVPSTSGAVTGGGWVHDPSYRDLPAPVSPEDDHGDFGISVHLAKEGSTAGHVEYAFQGADGTGYVIRSTSWLGGGLALDDGHATAAGGCEVTVVSPTGEVLSEHDGYSFRFDAVDGGKSTADAVALVVRSPDGDLYHRIGTPDALLPLGGGAVVVHR
jgi:phospholipase C